MFPADPPATLHDTLLALLPVIIGGVLTLLGGFGSGFLTHQLKASAERKDRRRQKLEELVEALYDLEHWLHSYEIKLHFFRKFDEEKSPISKIFVITRLYFPELVKEVDSFRIATGIYHMRIVSCYSEFSKMGLSGPSDTHKNELLVLRMALKHSHNVLLARASALMRSFL